MVNWQKVYTVTGYPLNDHARGPLGILVFSWAPWGVTKHHQYLYKYPCFILQDSVSTIVVGAARRCALRARLTDCRCP